jgi:hypothetical protein
METSEPSPRTAPSNDHLNAVGLGGTAENGEVSDGSPTLKAPRAPWWILIVPFFLSAFFYLSAVFAVFAPLPILFLRARSGRVPAFGAVVTNAALVLLATNRPSLAIYLVFIGALSMVMGELVDRRYSIEKTAVLTLAAVAVCGGLVVGWYSHIHHVNPIEEMRTLIAGTIETIQTAMPPSNTMDPADVDEWKQDALAEFPSVIALFAVVLVWANLSTLLRINPAGVRDKIGLAPTFLKEWKAPEWLVWPTIAAGFFLIVDAGPVTLVAMNVFRVLMAIYAIQGLSVLSFVFDVWNIRGFFRTLGFLISIFLMMPLLLSLGFFDLWFDFRGKFRQ